MSDESLFGFPIVERDDMTTPEVVLGVPTLRAETMSDRAKLAGPQPRFRYTLNVHDMTVTVGGIFPPELAPAVRRIAESRIPVMEPAARAAQRRALDDELREMIHGKPGAPKPLGFLNASNVKPS